jgi:PAS domain S-box-containing protein
MTIKTKILFWFLLPSILIVTVTAAFCYFYTYKTVKENIFNKLEIAADVLQGHICDFLDGKRGQTIDFSSDGFIKVRTEKITKGIDVDSSTFQLNRHLLYNKKALDEEAILEVFIVDMNGKIISSTEDSQIGQDISGELYFSRAKERGSFISDLHYFPEFKQNTFEVSVLMTANEGMGPIGIIVNRYRGDTLGKVTRSGIIDELGQVKQLRGLGQTGELYIVNRDKLMITGSRFVEDAILKQVVDTEGVKAAFDNGIGMIGTYPDYRGIPILGVSKYIEEMDWVIVASKDISEAFAPIMYLRNIIIIIAVTGIMAIVAIAIFISTGITRSIKKITKTTKRMASGDLEHPLESYKRTDELKELGESINLAMNRFRESNMFSVHSIGKNKLPFQQLNKSRDKWVETFDTITDIITIHDKDFGIVKANKAFFEKFNADKQQLNEKKRYEIFHGTDSLWHNCSLVKCATSLKPECEEVDDPNMGGTFLAFTYPILNEKGLFYGAVQQFRNITERKKAEEKIKRAKEFSEKLIETAQDAIVCIDEDGIVKVWNRSAEKTFGYSRVEIIGQSITTIIPEKYRKGHLEGLKRFLQTGQAKIIGSTIKVSGKTKEGVEIPIELSLSFQRMENKRYSFTGIIRDITSEEEAKKQLIDKTNELAYYSQTLEQKVEKRTLELKKVNKKLQEQDRMKTEFLATVSHELRTPLALIQGFARVIGEKFEDVIFAHVRTKDSKVQKSISKVKDHLDIIMSEGKRLTDLINDLLDITKIEAGKVEWRMESISIAEIIEQATAITSGFFEQNGFELIKDIEDGLPDVTGDSDRLIQVVINLISNAVKYTKEGSVTCKARKMNGEIVVSVIDTGTGIAEVDQEKIFEKFKQVGDARIDKRKGTGLGLPICKQIVLHHGGRIWMESGQGKGSNFSFTLPIPAL